VRTDDVRAAAAMGSAMHEHLHMRAALGVDAAMLRIPQIAARWHIVGDDARIFHWRCRSFEWSPPPGAIGETGLYMREDGTVERTEGGRGHYPGLPADAVAVGTIDLMWSEPEPLDLTDPLRPRCPPGAVLWVVDAKTGSTDHVTPIDRNLQVGGGTMMAARWTGATQAVPALLFMTPGPGDWDAPEVAWGPAELARAERRVRAVRAAKLDAWGRFARGEQLAFTESDKCAFCPGRLSCPPKIAMVKSALNDPRPLIVGPLSDAQVRRLAMNLADLETFARQARALLKDIVDDRGPVDIGDGLVWGPEASERKVLDPRKALPVLLRELGDDALDAFDVSKSAIERAVKERSAKGFGAGNMRRVMAALGEAEALVPQTSTTYHVFRPPVALPPMTPDTRLEEQLAASVRSEGLEIT